MSSFRKNKYTNSSILRFIIVSSRVSKRDFLMSTMALVNNEKMSENDKFTFFENVINDKFSVKESQIKECFDLFDANG